MRREHRFSLRHLPATLDDELTTRQRLRLQAHADDCPECGRCCATFCSFAAFSSAWGVAPER